MEKSEKRHFGEEIFSNLIYVSPLRAEEPLCSVIVSKAVQEAQPNLKVIADVFGCNYSVKKWKPADFCVLKSGQKMLEGLQAIVESTETNCTFFCSDCWKKTVVLKSGVSSEVEFIDEVEAAEDQVVAKEVVENEAIDDEIVEAEAIENEVVETEVVEDEVVEEEVLEDEVVEDEDVVKEAVVEKAVETEVVENEIVENEAIENAVVEKEVVEDEVDDDEEVVEEVIENEAIDRVGVMFRFFQKNWSIFSNFLTVQTTGMSSSL